MHSPQSDIILPHQDRFTADADPAFWDGVNNPNHELSNLTGGFSAAKAGPVNVENVAAASNLLPVKLPRTTCSIPAENLLRQIGRMATTAEPWLPVGTVGPFLIMGHCRPESRDCWGVPAAFIVRIVIDAGQYESILKDFITRLGFKPLAASNPCEGLTPPAFAGDLNAAFSWFTAHYPMSPDDREKMQRLLDEHGKKPLQLIDDLKFLPRHYGVCIMRLATGVPIYNPEEAPGQTMFPDTLLEKHNVFPLYCGKQHVYLLSATSSVYAFEDEWLSSGNDPVKVIPVLADTAAIRGAITRNRSRSSGSTASNVAVGEMTFSDNGQLVEIDPMDMARINPANPNNSAEQLVMWAIYRALTLRASDLHIEKFYNTARFRARIDGELVVIHSCSEEALQRTIAMVKNWSNMGQERQACQDGRFAMRVRQKRIDVRVAAVPHRKEFQKIIMRFLDKMDGIKKLSELNLSQRQMSIVKQIMGRDQGLALVTGPTGSGKTTTLYAFLNSINDDNINIQTIEDPIEYEIEGINQTQTDPFHGLTFANGLRALLRADPDVILIGESRDGETAGAAINAALTGHLVVTTLHANDSLRAISRLLSMGVEPYLLADALAMSQAQRLVRRLCPYCKAPAAITQEIQDFLYYQGCITEPLTDPLYQKVGCDECNSTGYSGRLALMEMCLINGELSNLIATGAPVNELRRAAEKDGFRTLYQEGLAQVISGNTTFDEISCLSYTSMS